MRDQSQRVLTRFLGGGPPNSLIVLGFFYCMVIDGPRVYYYFVLNESIQRCSVSAVDFYQAVLLLFNSNSQKCGVLIPSIPCPKLSVLLSFVSYYFIQSVVQSHVFDFPFLGGMLEALLG